MKLQMSISCNTVEDFQKVLFKLDKMGYVDGRPGQEGANIATYGMSHYHFGLGLRVINLYDNKSVKYASDSKRIKNVISSTDFLDKK